MIQRMLHRDSNSYVLRILLNANIWNEVLRVWTLMRFLSDNWLAFVSMEGKTWRQSHSQFTKVTQTCFGRYSILDFCLFPGEPVTFSNVSIQVAHSRTSGSADRAAERFFSSVHPYVHNQLLLRDELLATLVTLMQPRFLPEKKIPKCVFWMEWKKGNFSIFWK